MYDEDKVIRMTIHRFYRNTGLEYSEMYNIGYIGYLNAMKNADRPKEDVPMCYVQQYIRYEINKALKKETKHRNITGVFDSGEDGLDESYITEHLDPVYQAETVECPSVVDQCESAVVLKLVESLPERDSYILTQMYLKNRTMKDISQDLNISPQRVDQIHKRLIKMLRDKITGEL